MAKDTRDRTIYNKLRWQVLKDDPTHNGYHKKWLEDNKDHVREKAHEYYEAHKNEVTAYRNNDRVKRKGLSGKVEATDWIAIVIFFENKCVACEEYCEAPTMDHVLPLSKGGSHSLDNVQPLCYRCNIKKGTKEFDFRTRKFNKEV